MSSKSLRSTVLVLVGSVALAAPAAADEITHSQVFPLAASPWIEPVDIPQFDPLLGQLLETRITLSVHLEGSTAVENLHFTPQGVTTLACGGGQVNLRLVHSDTYEPVPGTAPVLAFDGDCANLPAFDGHVDFTGSSAATFVYTVDAQQTFSTNLGVGIPNPVSGGQLTVHTLEHGSLHGPDGVIPQLVSHRTSAVVEVTYVFDPEPNWADLGNALIGLTGEPALNGIGSLVANEPITFTLANARERATAWLVASAAAVDQPFKGGVLVPDPDAGLVLAFKTDGDGELFINGPWVAGIPPETSLYFQFWIEDFAAPEGLSASNAIVGTTPP